MFVFLKECYDPSVEGGFAEKKKRKENEVFVIVEGKLAGRGLARLGNILMSRS